MVSIMTQRLLVVLGGLLLATTLQAGISAKAHVDRTTITISDSLQLTISINDTGTYKTPDISALAADFEISGSTQSSKHSIINGKSSAITEWRFSLFPKREGKLVIPSFKINDARTAPININVKPANTNTANSNEPVFLEADISTDNAYIGEEIIYTLRIFHSIQLDNLNLSDINIDNASIKKIAQNSFYRTINGIQHRVHEVSFSLRANKAGQLYIPPQFFQAQVASRRLFSMDAQKIRKKSPAKTLTILDKPSNHKGDWLPAKSLTLEESYSGDLSQLKVGDAITRTININATGLAANQLPEITFKDINDLKYYPDKPQLSDSETSSGIIGQRIEAVAIIATEPGDYTLPAIKISWWDVKNDRARMAILPEKTLRVYSAANKPVTVSEAFDQVATKQPLTAVTPPAPNHWPIITAVITALWCITLFYCFYLQRILKGLNTHKQQENISSQRQASEKACFNRLKKACMSSHSDMHSALINWANSFWTNKSIKNFGDIVAASGIEGEKLKKAIENYERSRYSKASKASSSDFKAILECIKTIRSKKTSPTKLEALPDLYPKEAP